MTTVVLRVNESSVSTLFVLNESFLNILLQSYDGQSFTDCGTEFHYCDTLMHNLLN